MNFFSFIISFFLFFLHLLELFIWRRSFKFRLTICLFICISCSISFFFGFYFLYRNSCIVNFQGEIALIMSSKRFILFTLVNIILIWLLTYLSFLFFYLFANPINHIIFYHFKVVKLSFAPPFLKFLSRDLDIAGN